MRCQARVTKLIGSIQNSLTLLDAELVWRRFALDCLTPVNFAITPALNCSQTEPKLVTRPKSARSAFYCFGNQP